MQKRSRATSMGLSSGLVLGIGLLSLVSCSQNTASDSSQMTMEEGLGAQKFLASAQSQPVNHSSLDAHQQGTLDRNGPLGDVYFEFDRYDLSPQTKHTLNQIHAVWLKAHPQTAVEVEGHGDERGTNEYNLALGAKRAENVKRYLVDLGIAAGRLSTISYGEELQLCKDHNELCWAKNRRAHFAVRNMPTN